MPFTKVEGFLKEFPWVTKFIARADIKQVYVSRITCEVMDYKLIECGYASEEIFLLDADGCTVTNVKEVVIPAHSRRKFFLFGPMVHIPERRESIVDDFQGHKTPYNYLIRNILGCLNGGNINKVRFVVSYFELTHAVIIYKAPQGITIPDWIQQQIGSEQSAFKGQCQAIDTEATAK